MDFKQHSQPEKLERYSFIWSEIRLILAAIALFLGGTPVLYALVPAPSGLISSILTLCWIISGLAALYLLYRWFQNKQLLFGGKESKDTAAFMILVISGINLGLTGILRQNIGMNISSAQFIFVVVGIIYLVVAAYLYRRWKESGQKLF